MQMKIVNGRRAFISTAIDPFAANYRKSTFYICRYRGSLDRMLNERNWACLGREKNMQAQSNRWRILKLSVRLHSEDTVEWSTTIESTSGRTVHNNYASFLPDRGNLFIVNGFWLLDH